MPLWGHKFWRLIKTDKLESHRELRVIKFNQSWKPFDSLLERRQKLVLMLQWPGGGRIDRQEGILATTVTGSVIRQTTELGIKLHQFLTHSLTGREALAQLLQSPGG